jgi:small subunit ribosomal protein S8
MLQDPLSDAMSVIKNAEKAGKSDCIVRPSSKLIGRVLKVMQDAGYLRGFDPIEDGRGGKYRVQLNGQINDCGVVKPRYSVRKQEFEKWESRFLPAQDFGVLILTTTKGVVSHYKAKEIGTGGKLLAYVF